MRGWKLQFLISFMVVAPLALGQGVNGTITGTVTDPSSSVVSGAAVEATNVETGALYTAASTNAGNYALVNLPVGTYTVTAKASGFKTYTHTNLAITAGQVLKEDVELQVGSAAESVTVSAESSLLKTESGETAHNITLKEMDELPLLGISGGYRNPYATLTTLPGSSGGAVINGLGGNNTNAAYRIEGQDSSNRLFNLTEYPSMSQANVDAIQEISYQTSNYAAEFGQGGSMVVNMTMKSGTNQYHGSGFEYFVNEDLNAGYPFSISGGPGSTFGGNGGKFRPYYRRHDFGGTLGGPVEIPGLYNGKDKTFFFFSYEGMRLDVPQPAQTTDVPDTYLRQNAPPAVQLLLNTFPVQNGADDPNCLAPGPPAAGATCLALFTAAYSAPGSLDATSIRIDHTFGDKLKVFGRYSDSPSSDITRSTLDLAELIATTFNVKSLTLGATSAFSPRFSNDLRFNYTQNNNAYIESLDNFGSAQPVVPNQLFSQTPPSAYQFGAFLLAGTIPRFLVAPFRADQWQINVTDAFSVVFGSHVLKYGVDYRRLATTQSYNQLGNAVFFSGPAGVLTNSASAVVLTTVPSEPVFSNFSAYVQDEWRATSRLNVSAGLRWDLNPPPGNAVGSRPYTLNEITDLATAQLAPPGTPAWQTDHHGFAPRLGLAYQLRQASGHQTVLRGGVGLFYDLGNTLGAVGLNAVGFTAEAFIPSASFPLTPAQNMLAVVGTASPYDNAVKAFDPHLTLPYTLQWNVAIEQALGTSQSLTVTYVGASGYDLLNTRFLNLSGINPNFSLGNGLFLVTNGASSNYNALQVQFQRRLSHGFEVLTSYTWAHSIDNLSSNFLSQEPPIRGNSDFDIRHNFAAAWTYDLPGSYSSVLANAILKHWALDGRITARSALPVDIFSGTTFLPNGTEQNVRPDVVTGVPVYVADATAPGGRIVNANAFVPAAGEFGDEPRNFVRGFDLWQADLAIERDFHLHERLNLKFRAEAFNLLNHPNFGNIDNNLSDGPAFFGRATNTLNGQLGGLNPLYQVGGPRSIQFALKLTF